MNGPLFPLPLHVVYWYLNRHWGLLEFEAPRVSRQSSHEGGKVVSPTHRPLLPPPPGNIPGALISVRGRVDSRTIVLPEGLSERRIPTTPSYRQRNPRSGSSNCAITYPTFVKTLFIMCYNMDATGGAHLGTTICFDVGNWYTVIVNILAPELFF